MLYSIYFGEWKYISRSINFFILLGLWANSVCTYFVVYFYPFALLLFFFEKLPQEKSKHASCNIMSRFAIALAEN